MEEEKISFFQWFINVLKMERKKYEATGEEKLRIYNKINDNKKQINI